MLQFLHDQGENSGCWSYVGRLGGRQQLNLQLGGCIWDDIIIHEFLHAAGFYHQQSATERDDYVTIMWENITPGMYVHMQVDIQATVHEMFCKLRIGLLLENLFNSNLIQIRSDKCNFHSER